MEAQGPPPPRLWPDSLFSLRVNLANKVLLEQVVSVAPLVPWAPLDWLDPLASLDVRDLLVLKVPPDEMVLLAPRVTVVRPALLDPLVLLVLLVPLAPLALLARMATVARL
ncbi:hypothetical protein GH733_014140 [Mirounga leonina]|nr:hypothetical protein GH733_014140 [Mirounga leonina]